ncbi:hypothetical protein, partial [Desulfosporosinus fructosivorans]
SLIIVFLVLEKLLEVFQVFRDHIFKVIMTETFKTGTHDLPFTEEQSHPLPNRVPSVDHAGGRKRETNCSGTG